MYAFHLNELTFDLTQEAFLMVAENIGNVMEKSPIEPTNDSTARQWKALKRDKVTAS